MTLKLMTLYPSIEITEGGFLTTEDLVPIRCLKEDLLPTKPGIYQWRPIGYSLEGNSNHGVKVPVYGWADGVQSPYEMEPYIHLPCIYQSK